MANSVIIVAGGIGSRFGSSLPKQFLNLDGKPILMHTIGVFYKYNPLLEIIVVLPENQLDFWNELCKKHHFNIPHTTAPGGSERFYSVKNGLQAMRSGGIVAIHDAVRPLVSQATLRTCFETAELTGNAIPVVAPVDSVRMVEKDKSIQVDRSLYRLVQTPQCFRKELILAAFTKDFSSSFTDDASVAEAAGQAITLVEGNYENIKITTATDLKLAVAMLEQA